MITLLVVKKLERVIYIRKFSRRSKLGILLILVSMLITQFFVVRNNQIAAERLAAAQIEEEIALIKQKSEEYRVMAQTKAAVDARKVEAQANLEKLEAEKLAKAEAEKLAKAEAEKLAKAEAEKLAKAEAEKLAKAEAEKAATKTNKTETPVVAKPQVEASKPSVENCDALGERDALICLTNNARINANIKPLKVVGSMNDYALVRAKEIIVHFAHERPDGSSIGDQYGENLANGYSTAIGAFNGFWNSAGHKKNLLNPRYQTIGVGYTTDENGRGYWAMLFTY